MAASRMGVLMLGYAQPGGIGDIVAAKPKLAFFLGADDVDFTAFADTLKVYVGHHGGDHGRRGEHAADVSLTTPAWTGTDFTSLNKHRRASMGGTVCQDVVLWVVDVTVKKK